MKVCSYSILKTKFKQRKNLLLIVDILVFLCKVVTYVMLCKVVVQLLLFNKWNQNEISLGKTYERRWNEKKKLRYYFCETIAAYITLHNGYLICNKTILSQKWQSNFSKTGYNRMESLGIFLLEKTFYIDHLFLFQLTWYSN